MSGLSQLDLCSGVGAGFAMSGLITGFQLIGVAEIDEYCSDILKKRFPGVPNYGDVLRLHQCCGYLKPDIITASPPCQPFSTQGKRRGSADERDCIPSVLGAITRFQPQFWCIENVTGLLTCPSYPGQPTGSYFRGVLKTITECGYDAEWLRISSGHFAAPFRRERLLLVGFSRSLVFKHEPLPWTEQARSFIEEQRIAAQRRGVKPGYSERMVQSAADLPRSLGVKNGCPIVRRQRAAAGNLLDPRVALLVLRRVLYLSQLSTGG